MKVINKLNQSDEAWDISDVIDTWKHVKKANFQGVDEGRIF